VFIAVENKNLKCPAPPHLSLPASTTSWTWISSETQVTGNISVPQIHAERRSKLELRLTSDSESSAKDSPPDLWGGMYALAVIGCRPAS
jgi:hypothetical protein